MNETELILALSRINQVYSRATNDFEPSQIAHYCYDLCRQYNSFYHTHQIIGENGIDEFRLLLNNAIFQAVKMCFDAMGMVIPQKM
jgi:arginyl-tRNA synthetase